MAEHDIVFHWVFVFYMVICAILTIFFLLYFNRLIASVLSYAIRAWTWHHYKIWIDIQALQVSLLAGRVFFSGLRYHGANETFMVRNGHITWSYWLRRVREVDLTPPQNEPQAMKSDREKQDAEEASRLAESLPCRVNVRLTGVEWFIYNRTPAYDSILEAMLDSNEIETVVSGTDNSHSVRRGNTTPEKRESALGSLAGRGGADPRLKNDASDGISSAGIPMVMDLLPIHVECTKVALVAGNEHTKGVLICKSEFMDGEIDASHSSGPDPYRQVFKFRFQRVAVEMRDNLEYKEDLISKAQKEKEKEAATTIEATKRKSSLLRPRRPAFSRFRRFVPWRRYSENSRIGGSDGDLGGRAPGFDQWQGLARYVDEAAHDDNARWALVEYAAIPTILDSPEVTIVMYWDAVGKVTAEAWESTSSSNINGDTPPEFALHISLKGGVVNYGPWADRHRTHLQSMFVPFLAKDATPAERIPVGSFRVATQLKISIECEDELILRVPVKESSKDWKWRGQDVAAKRSEHSKRRFWGGTRKSQKDIPTVPERPHGWLEIKVGANMSATYTMDMAAGILGFCNSLRVDLPRADISSSVNHSLLCRSGPIRLDCDLSTPLKWNGRRTWSFNITANESELFLLRDHVFLFIDLVDDWATGPPPDYLLFTPFVYTVKFEARNLGLFLNVNDANIIEDPTSIDDNAFLGFKTSRLVAQVPIALDKFRPNSSRVPINVQIDPGSLRLQVPIWNTQSAFLRDNLVATINSIGIVGEYYYNTTTSTAKTDTLLLNVTMDGLVLTVYGFLIRYFLVLKENYLGDSIHFQTLQEYQGTLHQAPPQRPLKKSNDLDVMLNVSITSARILLPANLYEASTCTQMDLATIGLDLRFTNYYMDMVLDLSPITMSLGPATDGRSKASPQIYVDGVTIHGHRLFGLPPVEPTYMCNWDFAMGAITGDCQPAFLSALLRAAKAFVYSLDDTENALINLSNAIAHDVTFLRAKVASVKVWFHVDESAFLLSMGTILVKFNDWARAHYSSRAEIVMPDIRLSCVKDPTISRYHQPSALVTNAFIETSVRVVLISRLAHFKQLRQLQQETIRRHDQRTHRTPFLWVPEVLVNDMADNVDVPAQSVPPLTVPDAPCLNVSYYGQPASSIRSGSFGMRHKSSFLSLRSNSSVNSIVRPHSRYQARQGRRPSANTEKRDPAVSISSHTDFHSVLGDRDMRNSSCLDSQYYPPPFPLDLVQPQPQPWMPSIEMEEDDDVIFTTKKYHLDDLDDIGFDEDCTYMTVLAELPGSIAGYITPDFLESVSYLVTALQPSQPVDILDTWQMESVSASNEKQTAALNKVLDVSCKLPQAKLRLLLTPSHAQEQDQFTLDLSSLSVAVRIRQPDSRLSFDLSLESASVSVADGLVGSYNAQAAVVGSVHQVNLILGSRDIHYIDGRIGLSRGCMVSNKVQYLGSLVHRTRLFAVKTAQLFSEPAAAYEATKQHFAHWLLTKGQNSPDPPFLARPSAVLRSASSHLRSVDSWKLACRLRQMWTCLTASEQRLPAVAKVPNNARGLAMLVFRGWRDWDLGNLDECFLLDYIFGKVEKRKPAPEFLPLAAVICVEQFELVVDPGPKQNDIVMQDLTARIQTKEKVSPRTGLLEDLSLCPVLGVNVNCSSTDLTLKWELCQLLEEIMAYDTELFPVNTLQSPTKDTIKEELAPDDLVKPHVMHIVVALGKGSLRVEAVNLNAELELNDIQSSGIISKGGCYGDVTSVIVSCGTIGAQLASHAQSLVQLNLVSPSIFLSKEDKDDSLVSHLVKSTATCRHFEIAIKQDPPSLLEVVDLVVRDEVAQLYALFHKFPTACEAAPKPRRNSFVNKLSTTKLDLALFLESYCIRVTLLQSLTYIVSADQAARASIAARLGKEFVFDFDVQKKQHKMLINVRKEPRVISTFEIPPINGRVTSHMRNGENRVSVVSSLLLVTLDAAEVYSLLTALNRPEVFTAINDVQGQISVLKEHLSCIFGSKVDSNVPSKEPEITLIYDAHLTFEGLDIFGDTPSKSEHDSVTRHSCRLASVHIETCNRIGTRGPTLQYPDMHVNLKRIAFEMLRGTKSNVKFCGGLNFSALLAASSRVADDGIVERTFNLDSNSFAVNLSPDTIATLVDVLSFFADKIKDLDTSKELQYLKKLRQPNLKGKRPQSARNESHESSEQDFIDAFLSSFVYIFELRNIQLCWLVTGSPEHCASGCEDLVFNLERIAFNTRRKKTAKLIIENLQLQMVPPGQDKLARSANSALLPEVIFNIAYFSTAQARRIALQAAGKILDTRLTSAFIVPASRLLDSISLSANNARDAYAHWSPAMMVDKSSTETVTSTRTLFSNKRLESMLVDVDFAGAVVHLSGKITEYSSRRANLSGKYGQFNPTGSGASTMLKSPGLALKLEYRDTGSDDPTLYAEIKVDASNNILYPSVVPLIMEMSSSVKELVSDDRPDKAKNTEKKPRDGNTKPDEENILTADPTAVIGRLKLNVGLRIRQQEFSLSCQPIARVAATAKFDDVYLTINTIRSVDQGNFFAISTVFSGLKASVQHMYSRESTGSFEVESVVLSVINSKHVSGTSGLSALLKVSPMKMFINAKQLHDFFLFREIWVPAGVNSQQPAPNSPPPPPSRASMDASQAHLVQRYQQVAATAAFPWTATISIAALQVHVDLGQALGKAVFSIEEFWVSSKKTSDWDQNLCLGFNKIGIDCVGRLGGFISLRDFQLRTAMQWPMRERALSETPLVQASLGFSQLRIKISFDYQVFLVADLTSMNFLMHNVRQHEGGGGDRLVAIFDGGAVQIYGTTTSAAQSIALFQALQRLIAERKANFEASLKEVEKYMRRKTPVGNHATPQAKPTNLEVSTPHNPAIAKSPISLDSDVMVTFQTVNLGFFPSTFVDNQIFKVEALMAQLRFAASVEDRQIHSILGVTLGQLKIGLASVADDDLPRAASDVTVEQVVDWATSSRGGTILKVPKVEATMQTWQKPATTHIDYMFRSAFEGKVEVGWNYSRIGYIKRMWAHHSKALEQTWGKELQPLTAIKVTGVLPSGDADDNGKEPGNKDKKPQQQQRKEQQQQQQQRKITAEVNVPQSKYNYRALEPPVIETPQLRDMGEATPPLEWIGLHRDRLPTLTHQFVIVGLLELAGEVEDAYARILGSS